MIQCPNCQHFNLADASICERCGVSLVIADPDAGDISALDAQVLTIAGTGGKIAAIKWYRQQTGLGLKEAKDAVEALMRQHHVSPPKSGCAGMMLAVVIGALAGYCAVR
jgi:hypothetical protein